MNIGDIDRKLLVGINFAFLLLIFLLPLLLSTRSSEVFELPKMLFVYVMAAVIVGLWLGRMILGRQILIRRTPLDIPILLFLISQMVSTIYSIDPYVSWWGWYGRFHGGLASTATYTLLYYALVSNTSGTYKGLSGRTVKPYNGKTVIGKPVRQYTSYRSTDYRLTVSLFHRFLIKAVLSSALIVSAYALLQHFGIDKNFWVQDVANRVFSTQGQPNWLAGYIVMVLPVGWMLTIADFKMVSEKRKLIAILLYCYIAILFLALLWTKSRSGLIGLAAADLVFWSLIFFRFYLLKNRGYIDQQRPACHRPRPPRCLPEMLRISKQAGAKRCGQVAAKQLAGRSFKKQPTFLGTKRLYRLSTIVSNLYNFVARDKHGEKVSLVNLVRVRSFILIHILMIGLILATNNPVKEWMADRIRDPSAVEGGLGMTEKNTPAMETGITLRKSEHGGTESGDIRRIVWSGAIQLIKKRPFFGFGPETFGETYWGVRPKEHNLTSEWNFLYNKAHNEWLNLAANTGLFGLGSHLLLILWFSAWIIKRTVFGRSQGQSLINTAILAALFGAEVVNFFGFSTVTVGAYQYLFMAMAAATVRVKNQRLNTAALGPLPLALCLIIFSAVFYLLVQLIIFFLADLAYSRGRAYQDAGYIQEAVETLITAVNLVPAEPVFRAELGEAEGVLAAALLSQERTVLDVHKGQSLKDDAIANLEIARRRSPYNLGFVRTQANVLFLLREYDQAFQLMKLAMEMAPTNSQLPYSLGIMLEKIGQPEEAMLYYNKTAELKPDFR